MHAVRAHPGPGGGHNVGSHLYVAESLLSAHTQALGSRIHAAGTHTQAAVFTAHKQMEEGGSMLSEHTQAEGGGVHDPDTHTQAAESMVSTRIPRWQDVESMLSEHTKAFRSMLTQHM